MSRTGSIPNFDDYRTVSEAAEFLGVSTATLRNWDRAGKLKPRRHPQNGYRIYLHEDLEAVLQSADLSNLADESLAPQVDWREMGDTEHFVQFYENEEYLIDSVSGFVGAALTEGDGSIVIATKAHRDALRRKLSACGIAVTKAVAEGRYVSLDAAKTLSKFMVDGLPDPRRFESTVGVVVAEMAASGRKIHAFGEMVALLWAEGNRDAAIRLEELWNNLSKSHRFALFCAYPISGFDNHEHAAPFNGICASHSRVIPAESYAAVSSRDARLRAITLLQQKARSLQAEIEHRNAVEKDLSKRERELADFFDNATEGLHKVGPDGTILWANKAEYSQLGYAEHEYVGRSITDFHADADVITDMLERLKQGESLENFPARLKCKNGQIKHVLVNSNAFIDEGEFVYTRCFTRDVTRQWQAEQALRDSARRKDEFLATLAHELRNPLAPIKNALELLKLDGGNEATAQESRRVMERQVQQMTRLVDDLLDVSRISRDKIELRKQRIELATVLTGAIETSRPMIDSAGHALTVEIPKQPIYLHADTTRMAQVFSNLLNNAAKYTERGGRIELKVRQAGQEAIVSVRDNGIGISCEALAFVFDMFKQVDRSLDRAQGGLGIGLTLVRRLVELHGGTVNAQSEGLGKGSEFVVRLPLAGPETEEPESRRSVNVALVSNLRILIADDNSDSADTLCKLLRSKGHEVRTAQDGLQAIEVAEEFLPEVILMDVGMPKLDGYEATRRLRQLAAGREVLIVALTGWGQPGDVQRSAEAGCSAHLVKPVDFADLEHLLASQVSRHQ